MKNIFETAREDSRLSVSVRAAELSGLIGFFQDKGPYTAFIPTDEAYAEISQERLGIIMSDRERLSGLVKYHMVQGKLTIHDLARMEAIKTLQEDHLDVTVSPEGVMKLNDATIIQPNVECANGMYHIIDRVLVPRAVQARVERSI